jgi:hypothetical protein
MKKKEKLYLKILVILLFLFCISNNILNLKLLKNLEIIQTNVLLGIWTNLSIFSLKLFVLIFHNPLTNSSSVSSEYNTQLLNL